MTPGSELATILFVSGTLFLFLIFAIGVVSLQLCFNALYRRRAAQASSASSQSPSRRLQAVAGGGINTRTQTKLAGDPAAEAPRSLPATAVYRAAAACPAEECAVCLAGLEDGEEARLMPCCGHWFHALCVDTWLASHATCPLCRIAVARPGMASASASPLSRGASEVTVATATARDVIPSPRVTEVVVIDIPELAVPHGGHPK